MKLYRLLERMEYSVLSGSQDVEISTIEHDYSKVMKDSVFVCLLEQEEEILYACSEAINRGAIAIVLERPADVAEEITTVVVNDISTALAYMAASYYDYPGNKLKTIAVTGSKGKTTTCYMIKEMLEQEHLKVGIINDDSLAIKGKQNQKKKKPGAVLQFYKYLNDMVEEKVEVAIVEVSCYSIQCNQFAGITFDYAVLTTVSVKDTNRDGRLEYNDNYDQYITSKNQLFRQCKVGIVNADCLLLNEVLKNHSCRIETYGRKRDAMLYAYRPVLMEKTGYLGVQFYVGGGICSCFELWMPGLFNIYNALAAIMLARHFKVSVEHIKLALEQVVIKGRLEFLQMSSDYTVLVDNVDDSKSLTNLMMALKEYGKRRIVLVLDACSIQNQTDCYQLGKTAAKYAEEIVITMGEPDEVAMENAKIIQIAIIEQGGNYTWQESEAKAMCYCIRNAKYKDIIVLASKEKYTGKEYIQPLAESIK